MQLRRTFSFLACGFAAAALLSLLALPVAHAQKTAAPAQDTHLVSPTQLQQQVQDASAARQKNIDTLTQFLSSPAASEAMQSHRIDAKQVKDAIPTLSDAELADLSARAVHAQQDFAAGTMSNQTLLIIILVLVAVILIAVIH
jgi:phosphopantothenoylcysteine synthetase/decarboxylase